MVDTVYIVMKDEGIMEYKYYKNFDAAKVVADKNGGYVQSFSFDDEDLGYYKVYIFEFSYEGEDRQYICYCTEDEYKELNDGEIKENENSYEVWLKEDNVKKAEEILGKYLVEKRKNEQ